MSTISIENRKKLSELYYDKKNFFGRDKLYNLAQSEGINISRRQVMKWLQDQELYQRFVQPQKAKTIQPTVLKAPLKQLGIDLIDMQGKEYNKYRYILTCIDLFTKKAWAQAIKTKTDKDVVNALERIIKSIDSKISSIRSDRGPEFVNDKMKKMLHKFDVKQVLSLAYKPQSNGNVERFNGILKKLINKALRYTNSYDWISILPVLIDNYNNSKHSRTHKVPNEIEESDYEEVQDNIRKSVTSKNKKFEPHFDVGDRVRIQQENKDGSYWSKAIYKISKVYKPRQSVSRPHYLIDGFDKKFYDNDLQKINYVENEIDEDEQFEISKLLSPAFKNGQQSYYVKWKGYKDPTIERRDLLMEDVPKLVKQFEKQHKVIWYQNTFSWE